MGRLLLLVLLLLAPAWSQDLAAQEKRVQDLEAQAARARALEEEAAKRIQALNQELAQISQRLKNLLGEKAALEKEIARPRPKGGGSSKRRPALRRRCGKRRPGSPSWRKTPRPCGKGSRPSW